MREFSEGPWREVRDGTWVRQLQPAAVNAGLVVGDDAVLLVDTGSAPEQGRRLAASVVDLLGRPVTHVLITHWHFDHFFGLPGVEQASPQAVSVGHESLMEHLRHEDVDPQIIERDLGFDASLLHAPSNPIAMVRALDLGEWHGVRRRVEIVHPGHAHTDGDLVALVPDAHVAFVGDIVEQAGDPAIGDDAELSAWPAALDGVLSSAGHADDWVFVPGHGDPVDADFVSQQRIALASMYTTAEELMRKGVTLDDVVADFNGPREYEWPFEPQSVVNSLPNVFAELSRAGVHKKVTLPISAV